MSLGNYRYDWEMLQKCDLIIQLQLQASFSLLVFCHTQYFHRVFYGYSYDY